jgi:hypothetical protein
MSSVIVALIGSVCGPAVTLTLVSEQLGGVPKQSVVRVGGVVSDWAIENVGDVRHTTARTKRRRLFLIATPLMEEPKLSLWGPRAEVSRLYNEIDYLSTTAVLENEKSERLKIYPTPRSLTLEY